MTKQTSTPTTSGSGKESIRGVTAGRVEKAVKSKNTATKVHKGGHNTCVMCHVPLRSTTVKYCQCCASTIPSTQPEIYMEAEEDTVDIELDIPSSHENFFTTIASLRTEKRNL